MAVDRRRVKFEDAAAATAIAVERARLGVYSVGDDEPAPVREWLPPACERARCQATTTARHRSGGGRALLSGSWVFTP
jgi:hypothetical protein